MIFQRRSTSSSSVYCKWKGLEGEISSEDLQLVAHHPQVPLSQESVLHASPFEGTKAILAGARASFLDETVGSSRLPPCQHRMFFVANRTRAFDSKQFFCAGGRRPPSLFRAFSAMAALLGALCSTQVGWTDSIVPFSRTFAPG